jgi:hypothetical protein
MIDRQKVETILSRRFPGATWEQIAVATNAIVGLEDEWLEMECEPVSPLIDSREIRVFCRSVPQVSPVPTAEPADARSLEGVSNRTTTVLIYHSDEAGRKILRFAKRASWP